MTAVAVAVVFFLVLSPAIAAAALVVAAERAINHRSEQ